MTEDVTAGFVGAARSAMLQYEAAATRYAETVTREMELNDAQSIHKDRAIRRLMARDESGKTSYTAAEKIVEGEPEYAAFLKLRRDVVLNKNLAQSQREAARMRFELALALARAAPIGVSE